LDQLHDLVPLLGLEAAELILDVITRGLAYVEQVFALHIQFAGQDVDTDLVFLQASLLWRI
jgi:hypothetical protein